RGRFTSCKVRQAPARRFGPRWAAIATAGVYRGAVAFSIYSLQLRRTSPTPDPRGAGFRYSFHFRTESVTAALHGTERNISCRATIRMERMPFMDSPAVIPGG